jgi:RNA polymerase sigma factor (sigma-70 family)
MHDDPARSEDEALLHAVRSGRHGAFEQLVRRHQRLVWHLVQRLVHDREDTHELAQETFLRVHRTLHQFRGESRLSTWIGRIAWTIAARHLEVRRIELVAAPIGDDEGADDAPLPAAVLQAAAGVDLEAEAAERQLAERLRGELGALPPLQRTLLTLHHLHEMPIPEIAAITGLPAGTIKSHLFRGRAALRERLAPHLGLPTARPED